MENYRFIIMGKVQGVFYRKTISQKLQFLKIDGYVKNLKDGTVEVVVANISKEKLKDIIEILKKGSTHSRVDSIKKDKIPPININGFEIRY